MDAVEANKPVNLCFGIVTSTSPLKINVEQKMELGEAQLLLSRNVTDYTMKLEASMEFRSFRQHSITRFHAKYFSVLPHYSVQYKVFLPALLP